MGIWSGKGDRMVRTVGLGRGWGVRSPILNPLRATVLTYTHTKDQGQRSLSSKVRVDHAHLRDYLSI